MESLDKRIVAKKCSAYGCCKPVVAKGFCDMHRKRFERHGHILETRAADYGLRERHPLYDSWRSIARKSGGVAEEWKDFWAFVATVGERPSKDHQLGALEKERPLGPDNWYWREIHSKPSERVRNAAYMREYMKMRRASDPWHDFGLSLKRHYKMTVDEYLAIHDAQGGVCAICKKPESSVDPRTKRFRRLAVDHCHTQGHVRSLLCMACNSGLGAFKDDHDLLLAAAAYLKAHSKTV